jgi:hypothetical protein
VKTAHLPILALVLPACLFTGLARAESPARDPALFTASGAPGVRVQLPVKLGGGEQIAGMAPAGKPSRLYGMGLTKGAPGPPRRETRG